MESLVVWILLVTALICASSEEPSETPLPEKLALDAIFRRGHYDRRIRPAGINGTGLTQVEVSVQLQAIPAVSDQKMEYSTVLTLRQRWLDTRLRYEHFEDKVNHLTLRDVSSIWTPDVYFLNEREGRVSSRILPNSYVRIFPTGHVLYSTRLSLTFACPMDLRMFPMDRQTCSLELGSYAHTKDELVFTWNPQRSVQTSKNLKMARFHLDNLKSSSFDQRTSSGLFSCLRVELQLRRDFAYYMIQVYVPCCLIVVVSWFSFWLDATASPARTTLGVTTFVATAAQTSNVANALPPVSYTKAIDVWTAACLTFVISALLEYALVHKFARYERNRENQPKVREPSASGCAWLDKYPTRSKRLDMASRVIFPLSFFLFNLVYWTTYSLN